jgi:hypothetical protein
MRAAKKIIAVPGKSPIRREAKAQMDAVLQARLDRIQGLIINHAERGHDQVVGLNRHGEIVAVAP